MSHDGEVGPRTAQSGASSSSAQAVHSPTGGLASSAEPNSPVEDPPDMRLSNYHPWTAQVSAKATCSCVELSTAPTCRKQVSATGLRSSVAVDFEQPLHMQQVSLQGAKHSSYVQEASKHYRVKESHSCGC